MFIRFRLFAPHSLFLSGRRQNLPNRQSVKWFSLPLDIFSHFYLPLQHPVLSLPVPPVLLLLSTLLPNSQSTIFPPPRPPHPLSVPPV